MTEFAVEMQSQSGSDLALEWDNSLPWGSVGRWQYLNRSCKGLDLLRQQIGVEKMFQVLNDRLGRDCRPYIIAELSANHGGSIERASTNFATRPASAVKFRPIRPYHDPGLRPGRLQGQGGLWDGRTPMIFMQRPTRLSNGTRSCSSSIRMELRYFPHHSTRRPSTCSRSLARQHIKSHPSDDGSP